MVLNCDIPSKQVTENINPIYNTRNIFCVAGQTDRQTNRRTTRQIDRQIDIRTDRRTSRQKVGLTDRQTDGHGYIDSDADGDQE